MDNTVKSLQDMTHESALPCEEGWKWRQERRRPISLSGTNEPRDDNPRNYMQKKHPLIN